MTERDVISVLAGIDSASALAALRAQRPEAAMHAQGSYEALFVSFEPGGLTAGERFAVAAHVARLHQARTVEAHYGTHLAQVAPGWDTSTLPRLEAMSRHAELLSTRPADAEPGDLQALAEVGLSTAEIVTLSQVIAFVSFQVRVIAGLGALAASAGAAGEIRPGPGDSADGPPAGTTASAAADNGDRRRPATVLQPPSDLARPTKFTIEQLEWTPWLQPMDLADANPKQAAALEGTRGNSPYFRLLALDIDVLVERTATDRGIFYTPGGAPRADRELSAAATSRLNGCIYCTSVHARLASQLSKKTDAIERMLDRGVAPGTTLDLDPRWQAVVDLAVALAPTPPNLNRQQVQRLRELGLEDLEILDVIQAGAFFAWANRLMLTLGEPYVPTPSMAPAQGRTER